MKTSGIYQIKNTKNGKVYIGKALNIERRCGTHRSRLNTRCHDNKHLQAAWDKHGEDSFEFSVCQTIAYFAIMSYAETCWIATKQSSDPKYGYNKTCGGDGYPKGKKASAETKAKMSASQKGRKHTPEARARMSAAQRNRGPRTKATLETRQKMSEAHKNLPPRSAEHKENNAAANRGRKHTAEARANMSAAHKGQIISEETRQKISAFHKGKPLSPEHSAKISAALKGKSTWAKGTTKSPETKLKMSIAAKKRWNKNK